MLEINYLAVIVAAVAAFVVSSVWYILFGKERMKLLSNNPDAEGRYEVEVLLLPATDTIPLDSQVIQRAKELEALGYGAFDALHLSAAEAGNADVLPPRTRKNGYRIRGMTSVEQMTDDQFERYALEVPRRFSLK